MRTLMAGLWLLAAFAGFGNWTLQQSGTPSGFRGVRIVSETVAWASGTNGTFVRTVDGGTHWQSSVVLGAEKLDFRDIYAVDADTAYLLSIGEGENSRIYKTVDGGRKWILQFKNSNPKAFFDGIAFWDSRKGVAFSDPVDGHFVILRTTDGGAHWQPVSPARIPPVIPGEAAFAASGTSIVVEGNRNVWFGTGGTAARIFHSADGGVSWKVYATPIVSGSAGAGIFSIAFRDAVHGVIAGGDYQKEKVSNANFATTADGGKTWLSGASLPGYRSAISYVRVGSRFDLLACGPSGSDYSSDGGRSWSPIDSTSFNALSFLPNLPAGFAVGGSGRIAKWQSSPQ